MTRVCVVFGGISSEYEVSLNSAARVLGNLDKSRYDIIMLGITKDGRWLHYTGPAELVPTGEWEFSPWLRPAMFSVDRTRPGLLLLDDQAPSSVALRRRIVGSGAEPHRRTTLLGVDVVFPVLHGKNGEDGTIQGLLDLAGLPYVGCGVLSSALCMDKELSHILLTSAGIPKTKLFAVHSDEMASFDEKASFLEAELGWPMFVKPANAGSSVGVTKAKNREELREGLLLAFLHDRKAVVEQAIEGKEVECAVLGGRDAVAAKCLGEIDPSHEFYDYAGKYLDDSTALHIPARIGEGETGRARELAVWAYRTLGCKGLARVDFFVRPDGSVVLNEINTMPGFTPISMYPRLFQHDGMTISELLDRLIEIATGE